MLYIPFTAEHLQFLTRCTLIDCGSLCDMGCLFVYVLLLLVDELSCLGQWLSRVSQAGNQTRERERQGDRETQRESRQSQEDAM